MHPKTLLLQARNADDPMAAHEHGCFIDQTGLPAGNVVVHDLCAGPPSLAEVRGYDALMVGGSGDYYVSDGSLPHFESFLDLLRDVVGAGYPTFASCFGYQSLVAALGGEIMKDVANTEVGTYVLTLTADGRADELFGGFPDRFNAQLGRKDRAARLPDDIPNLARSDACPFQALRVRGAPIWATQFHPELDRTTNADRYLHYLEGYASHMSDEDRANALDRFRDSPETSGLLRHFVGLI